jgi:DNA repair protein RecN (Recombination protein N)
MLKELTLRNIATIDELRLECGPGFQVLTGETGAGKSILVEAIGLIMGDRADSTLVRDGTPEALVEAVFDVSQLSEVQGLVDELGLSHPDGGEELIIKRLLGADGRGRVFVNGQRATVAAITKLSRGLIDFTGQHQQIDLLDASNDAQTLDAFLTTPASLSEYQQAYQIFRRAEAELEALQKAEAQKGDRLEWLDARLKEIEKVDLSHSQIEEDLLAGRARLRHSVHLAEIASVAEQSLVGSKFNVASQIRHLRTLIEKRPEVALMLSAPLKLLEELQIRAEDVAYELARATDGVGDAESASLDAIEAKLFQIAQLKRKFGPELSDVLAHAEAMQKEQTLLADSDAALAQLGKARDQAFQKLIVAAQGLSQARAQAKKQIEEAIKIQLRELLMPDVSFLVDLTAVGSPDDAASYGSSGFERVTFLLSPNPGLSPRPLAKVASGGEASRIFLALKQILTRKRAGGTLIFDEIDTGISGAAVELVGKKLKALAERFQVFCVTHNAPIAALADRHFTVSKTVVSGKTFTRVTDLKGEARIQEMARLMGGVEISKTSVAHARELLRKGKA